MKTLFITRHYLDEMLGGPNCSKAFVRAVASVCPDTNIMTGRATSTSLRSMTE